MGEKGEGSGGKGGGKWGERGRELGMGYPPLSTPSEGGIGKSVPRITDWHHEVFRVMTKGRIFLFHSHTNNGFFFLFTTEYLILYW